MHGLGKGMLVGLVATMSGCAAGDPADGDQSQNAVAVKAFQEVACAGFEPVKALLPNGAAALGPARCGYMTVPESRIGRSHASVRLPVVVGQATAATTKAPPLLMLNGGPGGSSVSFLGGPVDGKDFAVLRRTRDIVLVNERGVEFSEPHLSCGELDDLAPKVLGADHTIQEISATDRLAAVAGCYERWTRSGVDLGSYNVLEMTSDVHETMRALGYDAYDIYGVSFGSMFTQQIAKRFPGEVKRIVLDSPVAVDGNLIVDVTSAGGSSDHALRTLFEACAADATCNGKHPDLREKLLADVANLNASPAPFPIADPKDPKAPPFMWQITGDTVVGNIVATMAPGAVGTFPALIDGIFAGGAAKDATLGRIGSFAGASVIPGKDDDHAMNLSVVCAGWGFVSPSEIVDGGDPLLRNITAIGKNQLAECTRWAVPKVRDAWPEVNAPLVSDSIAALLLPAKFDANTPPETAAKIATHLKRAYVHMWPDRGHAMMDFKCAGPVIDAFLGDPSRDPDASCIESQRIDWQ
jgi:pimeloyl-ACP methyl ester carboxylesterase